MTFYHFDASAVVKYFHREPGSAWVRQIVEATQPALALRVNTIYISATSIAEVPAAFAILARNKQMSISLRDRLYRAFIASLRRDFRPIQVRLNILHQAARLTQQHPLKGYDAVQLATALDIANVLQAQNLSLIFVSGDTQLLQAAQAEGLAIDDPFAHTDLDSSSKTP